MRNKKPALILAASLAALAAGVSAPAALADCVDSAQVEYVGSDWGPTPLWRVIVPGGSYDVGAFSADEARAAVRPFVSCPTPPPVDPPVVPDPTPPAGDPPANTPPASGPGAPAVAPGAPSEAATAQAATIVTDATVTWVGDSWGPVPVWRVHVPSRNATYDVAAVNAAAARAAVLGVVASDIDRNPDAAPALVSQTMSTALAALTGDPVQVDMTPVAPFAGIVAKTPAKAKTAKKGVHSAPATAKSR